MLVDWCTICVKSPSYDALTLNKKAYCGLNIGAAECHVFCKAKSNVFKVQSFLAANQKSSARNCLKSKIRLVECRRAGEKGKRGKCLPLSLFILTNEVWH